MPILRAKKVEIQTYVAEVEVTAEEAKSLTTEREVDDFVDARGCWRYQDGTAELIEGWEITDE